MRTAISEVGARKRVPKASTRAAHLSAAGAALFLMLLGVVHVIKPEVDPSWRFISEYAIGDHGWLMVFAFLALAFSCLTLVVAIRSEMRTKAAVVGVVFLVASAAGLAIAAVFTADPITATGDEVTTPGTVHGVGTVIATLGIPIAAALITRGLRRNHAWSSARRSLLWATGFAWIGLLAFEVSFAVLVPGRGLGPDVAIGWPNRFLIVTYAVWLVVAARNAARVGTDDSSGVASS